MVIMHRRIPGKSSLLVVTPYKFSWYTSNSGLVEKVEVKAGMVRRVSCIHLLPCLSAPEQIQIDKLLVDIVDEDVKERSNAELLPWGSPQPPDNADIVGPSRYPVAPAGFTE